MNGLNVVVGRSYIISKFPYRKSILKVTSLNDYGVSGIITKCYRYGKKEFLIDQVPATFKYHDIKEIAMNRNGANT